MAVSLLAAGCLAPELEGEAPTDVPPTTSRAEEDARLTRLLAGRGFPADQVVFSDDEVIIDGDTVLDRQTLLAELSAGEVQDGVETVNQAAYWFRPNAGQGPPPGWVPSAGEVRLSFTRSVNAAVRAAVTRAATLWGMAAGPEGCVAVNELNPGRVLTVTVQPLEGRDPTTGETFAVAGRARLPMFQNGQWEVGNMMWIDPDTANAVTLSDRRWLEHVAVHEMGHILGFAHPQEVGRAHHIPGTRQRPTRGAYPTVMDYDGEERDLSPDDVNAARRVYGPDMAGVCPGDR